jgi:hypothetical protein
LLEKRNDVDKLWEKYLISEHLKKHEYQKISSNNYLWKTYDQKGLNWPEEKSEKLFVYEFKWSPNKKIKIPINFKKASQDANFEVIQRDNSLDFMT